MKSHVCRLTLGVLVSMWRLNFPSHTAFAMIVVIQFVDDALVLVPYCSQFLCGLE
jgi:hypothetical protein